MMADYKDDDGGVGYKRPPKHAQFKPGQSGNPTGRPRGSRSIKTDLRDELNEAVRMRDRGRDVEVTKQRAILKTMISSAIDGDSRATAAFISLCARVFGDESREDQGEPTAGDEFDIVKEFVAREEKRRAATDTEPLPPPQTPSSGEAT
jgi:hypothetical protein